MCKIIQNLYSRFVFARSARKNRTMEAQKSSTHLASVCFTLVFATVKSLIAKLWRPLVSLAAAEWGERYEARAKQRSRATLIVVHLLCALNVA